MKEQVTHRRAIDADYDAIIVILSNTFNEYEIRLPENYSFHDIENIEKSYIDTGGAFIVLERNKEVIGFFGLIPVDKTSIELKRLYLSSNERGKGFGKYLLQTAINISKKQGYRVLCLETTSKFREAVGLYNKYGFVDSRDAVKSDGHDVVLKRIL